VERVLYAGWAVLPLQSVGPLRVLFRNHLLDAAVATSR
jgi:hypothetical protein